MLVICFQANDYNANLIIIINSNALFCGYNVIKYMSV